MLTETQICEYAFRQYQDEAAEYWKHTYSHDPLRDAHGEDRRGEGVLESNNSQVGQTYCEYPVSSHDLEKNGKPNETFTAIE